MFIISNNYRAIYVYNTCLKYSLIILNLILTANWDMDSVMTATLEMIKKWENEFEVTEQTKKKKNETGGAKIKHSCQLLSYSKIQNLITKLWYYMFSQDKVFFKVICFNFMIWN